MVNLSRNERSRLHSRIEAKRDAVHGRDRDLPCRLAFFTVEGNTPRGRTLSTLIPVLVTGIQQRRVCGAGSVLSAQGLGLAGFL
ncbi:hypothetical protein GOB13_25370 [Sinorhizobium meliloti]|nr:hypothetical protein [Sinorhizobium meliloti]MDW9454615.1 hypothetical protein [Sinorhizobium meliloti]MDW9520283.1 hypothetical protein [Sinorhizobium meliloti]MDW9558567.1 hypothetical protein [Sinorhizobium meliloti]MDW9600111.1 hypothetical protein [Sinorhizobium meliloti]